MKSNSRPPKGPIEWGSKARKEEARLRRPTFRAEHLRNEIEAEGEDDQ